jgi:hypothetical protein
MFTSTHGSDTGNTSPTAHAQQRQPPPTQPRPHPAKPARSQALGARGILERRRERTAARKRSVLARWLRRTANHRPDPDPIARRRQLLLHDRTAAVRSELLEIAAMLERANDPDPASIAALHKLLANGCGSPLYNPDIHVSELRATLYGVRGGLVRAEHGSLTRTRTGGDPTP